MKDDPAAIALTVARRKLTFEDGEIYTSDDRETAKTYALISIAESLIAINEALQRIARQ